MRLPARAQRPGRVAAWPQVGRAVQPLLRQPDAGAARDRDDGPGRDGGGDARDLRRAAGAGPAAGRAGGGRGDPDDRDDDNGARVAAVEPGRSLALVRGREPRSLHASSYPHAPGLRFAAASSHPAMAQAPSDGEWTMPAQGLRRHQVQPTGADHPRQRDPPPAGMDLLDRGPRPGTRGSRWSCNNTMYVVTPWPNVLYAFDLTQEGYPLKWKYRPDVEPECDRGVLLRRDQPRRLLRGREDRLQPARRAHGRGGRGDGQGTVEDPDRRPRRGRDYADGASRGQGPGDRGAFRGRVRHLRMGEGPRSRDRQGGVDRDEHRARRRGAGPARHLQAVLRQGRRAGRAELADSAYRTGGAPVWGWMSYDPELDLVYYGVGNPVTLQRGAAAGRQQVDRERAGAAPGRRRAVWAYQFTPHDNWDSTPSPP